MTEVSTSSSPVCSRGRPLLSILLPTYNYPEGVARILCALADVDAGLVEILISDDSTQEEAAARIKQLSTGMRAVRYRRNADPLGAPANWNSLLSEAQGRYCWLMHHDECPGARTVHQVLRRIRESGPDVLLLDCIKEAQSRAPRLHSARYLRAWVARRAPAYVFCRNVFGPAATLVVRRELCPLYDTNLKWLVDVEAYFRTFVQATRVECVDDAYVVSQIDRPQSITCGIGSNIAAIRSAELSYLCKKYPSSRALALLEGGSAFARCAQAVELAAWCGISLLQRTGATGWFRKHATEPERRSARVGKRRE